MHQNTSALSCHSAALNADSSGKAAEEPWNEQQRPSIGVAKATY